MANLKIHGQRLKNFKKNQRLPWKNASFGRFHAKFAWQRLQRVKAE